MALRASLVRVTPRVRWLAKGRFSVRRIRGEMEWGGEMFKQTTTHHSTLRGIGACVTNRCAGPGQEPWLVRSPAPALLLTPREPLRSCLDLADPRALFMITRWAWGSPNSISDRFYPVYLWFSKQHAQNNSINITRKLARRINSWVPSHIHWIRNSGAQESVFSIPHASDSDAHVQLW